MPTLNHSEMLPLAHMLYPFYYTTDQLVHLIYRKLLFARFDFTCILVATFTG